MEMWKQLKGYEWLYQISSYGRVKSFISNPKLLKLQQGKKYKHFVAYKDGARKTLTVHRQVAINFIYNPKNKPCVNHKDGNVNNNSSDNLEWVTHSENEKHSYRVLGKKANKPFLGKRAVNAKFSDEVVLLIRSDNRNISEISRHYNTARATIRDIKNKKTYADI